MVKTKSCIIYASSLNCKNFILHQFLNMFLGPPAPHLNPGGIPPSGTPYSSNYNPNSYPTSRQQYSQGPSPYPQQPNYGHVSFLPCSMGSHIQTLKQK